MERIRAYWEFLVEVDDVVIPHFNLVRPIKKPINIDYYYSYVVRILFIKINCLQIYDLAKRRYLDFEM